MFLKHVCQSKNETFITIMAGCCIASCCFSSEQHRDFLKERMDPDSGLLLIIHANKVIDWDKMDDVTSQISSCERNSKLLDYILDGDQCDGLITALQNAD